MRSRCDKSAVDHPEKSAADRNAIPRQLPWAQAGHLRSKIKPQSHVRRDRLGGVPGKKLSNYYYKWAVPIVKLLGHLSICEEEAIKVFPYIEEGEIAWDVYMIFCDSSAAALM